MLTGAWSEGRSHSRASSCTRATARPVWNTASFRPGAPVVVTAVNGPRLVVREG